MAINGYSKHETFSKPVIPIDLDELPDRYGWPRENASGYRISEKLSGTRRPLRIVHVGCGAAGICIAKFLPERNIPRSSFVDTSRCRLMSELAIIVNGGFADVYIQRNYFLSDITMRLSGIN